MLNSAMVSYRKAGVSRRSEILYGVVQKSDTPV